MSQSVAPVLEVGTGLACTSPTLRGRCREVPADLRVMQREDGATTCTFSWPLDQPLGDLPAVDAFARPGVLRLVQTRESDGDLFDEWEIVDREVHRTKAGGTITITGARPTSALRRDLVHEATAAGGQRTALSASGQTAQQLRDTYILPGLPLWVGGGMVQGGAATVVIDRLTWTDLNREDLLNQIVAAVQGTGVPCVWRWRRVGRTGYVIDLGDSIGALDAALGLTVTMPELLLGVHLTELTTYDRAAEQLTAGQIRSSAGIDHAHAPWRVIAVDLIAQTVQVDDPEGGPGPVSEDGEFVDWGRFYALQSVTGRLYPIIDTAAPGLFTLAEVPVSFAIGHRIEIRRDAIAGIAPVVQGLSATISSVGATSGAGQIVALAAVQPGGDAVAFDGQYQDARASLAVVCSGAFGIYLSKPAGSPSTRFITGGFLPGVGALSLGDIFYFFTNWYQVVAINVGAGTIDVVNAFTGAAPPVLGTGGTYYTFYRRTGHQFRASASVASTNRVTLTPIGASGATLADLAATVLLEWTRDPSGALLTELAPPSGVAAFDRVLGVITRRDLDGATNLVPDAYLEGWSGGPSAPPDGWTVGSSVSAQRYGSTGYASTQAGLVVPAFGDSLAVFTITASGPNGQLRGPVTQWIDAADTDRLSVVVQLLIDADPTTFSAPDANTGDGGRGLAVYVDVLDAGGAVVLTLGAASCFTAGALTTFTMNDLSFDRAGRLQLRLVPLAGQETIGGTVYPIPWSSGGIPVALDAVLIARGSPAPTMRRGSDGRRLWQALHAEVARCVDGLPETQVTLRDLARRDPAAWGHAAVSVGVTTRLRTTAGHPAPLDTSLLVTERDASGCDPLDTRVTIRSRRQILADAVRAIVAPTSTA